jgi:hypothetical protein
LNRWGSLSLSERAMLHGVSYDCWAHWNTLIKSKRITPCSPFLIVVCHEVMVPIYITQCYIPTRITTKFKTSHILLLFLRSSRVGSCTECRIICGLPRSEIVSSCYRASKYRQCHWKLPFTVFSPSTAKRLDALVVCSRKVTAFPRPYEIHTNCGAVPPSCPADYQRVTLIFHLHLVQMRMHGANLFFTIRLDMM